MGHDVTEFGPGMAQRMSNRRASERLSPAQATLYEADGFQKTWQTKPLGPLARLM